MTAALYLWILRNKIYGGNIMATNQRQYLLPGDNITLKKININTGKALARDLTEFSVISVVGEGGSSVCYEVYCESDGFHGRLKEFYPLDIPEQNKFFALERGGDNQLTVPAALSEAKESFCAAKHEFKEAYRTIEKVKNKKHASALKNYTPVFEIYEGTPSGTDSTGSVYVWTRHDKEIKLFDEYIAEVKEDIKEAKQPEHHLFNILTAVFKLTACVSVLHLSDLIHMDIKPGNFGLSLDAAGQVDAGNISLFDVNTIYPVNSSFIRIAGTEGFMAPEIAEGRASCKSDIYSIGATLFYALTHSDSFDGIYRESHYGEIDKYLANSPLIRCSDKNSNSALHDLLAKMLKACLAHDPSKRYKACSYLAEELKNAIAFLLPDEAESVLTELGQDIRIVNVEEYLDNEISSGALGAIQRLLFEHPLYGVDTDGKIDVLVLGAGTYAQKFIDMAFEVAQVKDCTLRITAVSNNVKADKERYLSARPAFTRFFNVDGISPLGEPLGYLNFEPVDKAYPEIMFTREDQVVNSKIISKHILDSDGRDYSYIFIALGDDELNRCVAEECNVCSKLLERKTEIYFVWYGAKRSFEGLSPVYVNDVISESGYYRDLKRMALNCHLLWNRSLNTDIRKLKGEFSSDYNFNSSFSNVLSVKYKLHSVGIDNMQDYASAAREFGRIIKKDKSVINSLVTYEHRRWMVNQICQGWDTLTDYSSLSNSTKDKKEKLHPCLVHSETKWTLSLPEWKNNHRRKWDTATAGELDALDALDRVSVELHRHFAKRAKSVGGMIALQSDIDKISNSLKFYPEALKDFEKLVVCITEIIEGRSKQTSLYTYYNKCFREELKKLPGEISYELEKLLQVIENVFYPVLQSQMYTDYKEFDRDMVVGIPYILTYSTGIRLCIPFGVEEKGNFNNRVLFGNVASALILNPSVITYVVDAEDVEEDKNKFIRGLEYAVNCMQKRCMQARVNLLFLQPSRNNIADASFREEIKAISPRIGSIEIVEYLDDTDLKLRLTEYIKDRQKNKKKCFSAIERNRTGISKLLRGLGCYEMIPAYEYDSVKCSFETSAECEYFSYVRNNDYLRVSDMFEFHAAESSNTLPEMQADYMFFWKLYKSENADDPRQQNEKVWKKLCEKLKEHSRVNDLIIKFENPRKDDRTLSSVENKVYYIPDFCRDGAEKILHDLKGVNELFTGDNPVVSYHNSATCRVMLRTTIEIGKKFDELFANPYVLCDVSKLWVEKHGKSVEVYHNNLRVENLRKSELTSAFTDKALSERMLNILKRLSEKKYIMNYHDGDNSADACISFTYSSPQIKSVMTNEGRVLELYVYYKALEQNYFDDVVTGCEIVWNDDNISNEFDVVLTKGYKALIVECKAQTQIKQEFYYKLGQLNQRFGINAVPVLVADTIELAKFDNSVNESQRARGNDLGIRTVYSAGEIVEKSGGTGVGATLRKIMESIL